MINFDGCWHGMALSHVYCHTGLPGYVNWCQVLKCGHNDENEINNINKSGYGILLDTFLQ